VDTILTPADQIKVNQWAAECEGELQANRVQSFTTQYLDTAKTLKDEGGELHDRIMEMLTSPKSEFNVTMTGFKNGRYDAERNYYRAKIALLSGKVDQKIIGIGAGQSPTGSAPTIPNAQPDTPIKKTPTVTPDMLAAGRALGLSDDDIREALS
jgi:hypothetical protein